MDDPLGEASPVCWYSMEHVRWLDRPNLRRPVVVAAFEGWNDAADAASTAVRYLSDRWNARHFADVDAEVFYDFTQARPEVQLDEGNQRDLIWPRNAFSAAPVAGVGDVILFEGIEPSLMWRTYCRQILDVARQYDARMVVTMGALVADVPHSRPVELYGTGNGVDLGAFGLQASTYEGPTGIVGVLHAETRDAGIASASLWAATPSYVRGAASPKAALALVNTCAGLLDVSIPTTDLEIASAAYERQVNRLVADDDDTASLVRRLEEQYDELADPSALVAEVERFLRESTDE